MSGIPSDIAGSAAQAGYQQMEAARVRDGDRAGQAHAARSRNRAVTEAADTVETTDADVRVYADAEGAGGQGRHFEEEGGEESISPEAAGERADERAGGDTDGPLLDIQA